MSYRQPGQPDKYVIEEKVIVNRIFKFPTMPKIRKWIPAFAITTMSPIAGGFAWNAYSGGILFGLEMSLFFVSIVSLIYGIASIDREGW